MAVKDRIHINNLPLNYTCENRRFQTNIDKGFAHGRGNAKGSVLENALFSDDKNGYSMWLEHVIEKETDWEVYWLMWYDKHGTPTIPASSIFSKDDLLTFINKIKVTDFQL